MRKESLPLDLVDSQVPARENNQVQGMAAKPTKTTNTTTRCDSLLHNSKEVDLS